MMRKYLLTGDKFMFKMTLKKSGFTYITCDNTIY